MKKKEQYCILGWLKLNLLGSWLSVSVKKVGCGFWIPGPNHFFALSFTLYELPEISAVSQLSFFG